MNQKRSPLISVIIPAYNAYETIERALTSVRVQTYPNVQAVIIDDGSTDYTTQIIEKAQNSSLQIKFLRNSCNMGVSASRNLGIKIADGDWITFLDADDYFKKDYIERVSANFEKFDFICTSFSQIDEKGRERIRQHSMPESMTLCDRELLNYMENYFFMPYKFTALMHCWNKFFKSDIISDYKVNFDENLSQLEDIKFVSDYLRSSKQKIYFDYPGVVHSITKDSNNLSSKSGTERRAPENLLCALSSMKILKEKLLFSSKQPEKVCYQHFVCSMAILFCIRISRQFWRQPNVSLLSKIYQLISYKPIRTFAPFFMNVPTESQLFAFSFRNFHSTISTIILIFLRR